MRCYKKKMNMVIFLRVRYQYYFFIDYFLEFKIHCKIEWKIQIFPICPLPPHIFSLPCCQHPYRNGTFLTIKFTLTHHYQSKSVFYIRLIYHVHNFFGEVSFQIFCPCFLRLFIFLLFLLFSCYSFKGSFRF